MKIIISNISYSFDDEGNTSSISAALSGNGNGNYVNATIILTNDDLSGNTLDDLNRKQIQEQARTKFIKLVTPQTAVQK